MSEPLRNQAYWVAERSGQIPPSYTIPTPFLLCMKTTIILRAVYASKRGWELLLSFAYKILFSLSAFLKNLVRLHLGCLYGDSPFMSRNKRPSVSSLFSRPQAVQAMQSIAGVQREGRAPLALPAQGCPPHRRISRIGAFHSQGRSPFYSASV